MAVGFVMSVGFRPEESIIPGQQPASSCAPWVGRSTRSMDRPGHSHHPRPRFGLPDTLPGGVPWCARNERAGWNTPEIAYAATHFAHQFLALVSIIAGTFLIGAW